MRKLIRDLNQIPSHRNVLEIIFFKFVLHFQIPEQQCKVDCTGFIYRESPTTDNVGSKSNNTTTTCIISIFNCCGTSCSVWHDNYRKLSEDCFKVKTIHTSSIEKQYSESIKLKVLNDI